jgi:hypothetical protein
VNYARNYTAANDSLRFTVAGGSQVAVGGFSSADVTLYDVTTSVPQAVAATVNAGTLNATVSGSGLRTLLAVGATGRVAPASITAVSADSVTGVAADYVVVAYDSMLAAAGQLAAARAGEGLTTAVVPVSAIYDQFGSGAPSAAAVTDFLTRLQTNRNGVRGYVVLLGSASYDGANYLGYGNTNLVPTGYVTTAALEWVASDAKLASGNGTPGLAVGRLPARTPQEADAIVSKLLAYGATAHTWTTKAALVSDQADSSNTFDVFSDRLADTLVNQAPTRIYESQYGAGTSTAIVNNLNSGTALVNYYGHGNYTAWANTLFSTSLLAQLTNAGKEAFVTSMTCYTGAYNLPGNRSLTAELLLKAQGGAIGAIGGDVMSWSFQQHTLNNAFYRSLLAGERVGDALLAGYEAVGDAGVYQQFHLLGDPTMRVDLGR